MPILDSFSKLEARASGAGHAPPATRALPSPLSLSLQCQPENARNVPPPARLPSPGWGWGSTCCSEPCSTGHMCLVS